jgi:hypothetical protein
VKKLIIAVILMLSACATGQYNNPHTKKSEPRIKWESPEPRDNMICNWIEEEWLLWCYYPENRA